MALTQVSTNGIADGAVTANDLENSGVTAGTYGSSSAIPAITVDAKGRVTSASTSSIDSTAITNGTSNVSVAASGNITVTRGGSTVGTFQSDGLLFSDTFKAKFGNSNDLEIYHDGSNSIIADAGTGQLHLRTNQLRINNAANTESLIVADQDGNVQLYHNGSEKFETTSSGVNVTGTVTCDGLTCDGSATISAATGYLNLKDSDNDGVAAQQVIFGVDSAGNTDWYVGQNSSSTNNMRVINALTAPLELGTNNVVRTVITGDGHLTPAANNTYDLGTSSLRWRNVYTNDLNLSNEGGTNDVDGTWGSWTIQEGEDDLFLLNRRNGKKYKFALTEVN